MKGAFLGSLFFFFISCSKDSKLPTGEELSANNTLDAIVRLPTGPPVAIHARGFKASIIVGAAGYGMYLRGKGMTAVDPAIELQAGLIWPASAGTYPFNCTYYPRGDSSGIQAYGNWLSSNPGSITFTTLRDHYAKGYFDATCKLNTDSVYITGEFEGYIIIQ